MQRSSIKGCVRSLRLVNDQIELKNIPERESQSSRQNMEKLPPIHSSRVDLDEPDVNNRSECTEGKVPEKVPSYQYVAGTERYCST